MKHKLLLILSLFSITILMTACSGQVADKMAAVEPALLSDPCAAIDQKEMRLDRFTEVVKNTSAFHLEEKATALPVPGITVSNNRKQMLKDAEKKYAEYSAERQKYGCAAPVTSGTTQISDTMTPCAVVDRKLVRLNEFAIMVKNTSSFHLEEKAAALPVPGITVSNNKDQMIRDIKKKYAELLVEREKYGCSTPMNVDIAKMLDKTAAVSKPTLLSDQRDAIEKKPIKSVESTTVVNNTTASPLEEKTATVPVSGIAVSHKKEQIHRDTKQKQVEPSVERQKYSEEAPRAMATPKMSDKREVVSKPALSSDACASIVEDLIKLDEFATMVNNTSAFHLEEKAEALAVPGITVSNNKKKMLRDVERKRAKLLVEHEKYGCETADKR